MVMGVGLGCLTTIFQLLNPNPSTISQQGLWIRAVSTAHPDSISRIIELCDELAITDIYVQVVVGGYAYYDSRLLPKSQYLTKVAGSNYDPLDSLLKLAHQHNIRYHAWVNASLVWSLSTLPDSLNHVIYAHPNWFAKDIHNKSMANYSYQKWSGLGLEGLFLDPAQDSVEQFLIDIVAEIVRKYPVDGLHLDFIRYPGIFWGLGNSEAASIMAGFEADTLMRFGLIRYPLLPLSSRWMIWHYYQMNQAREKAISSTVESVAKTVHQSALKNHCLVSAAVLAHPSVASFRYGQAWWRWEKALDLPVIMSYTRDMNQFADFLNFAMLHRADAIMGIGILWPNMDSTIIWQREFAKDHQVAGICYFDYTNIDTMPDRTCLKTALRPLQESLANTTTHDSITSVFQDLPDSHWVATGQKLIAWPEDLEFAAFLLSLSLNPERDLARLDLTRQEFLNKIFEDVAAFKSFDKAIFPLHDSLLEPPSREISYALLPWTQGDSALLKRRAQKVKKLPLHKTIYPISMDPLARAVFGAKKGDKVIYSTGDGIYIFRVKKIKKDSRLVAKDKVKSELLPIYQSWTIQTKLKTLLENTD